MNEATAEVMSGSVLFTPAAEARSGSAAEPNLPETCMPSPERPERVSESSINMSCKCMHSLHTRRAVVHAAHFSFCWNEAPSAVAASVSAQNFCNLVRRDWKADWKTAAAFRATGLCRGPGKNRSR